MAKTNPKVDAILSKQKRWRRELEKLRAILLRSGLDEEVKWRWPCYTLGGKNVVLVHGFKEYCGVLFFKGALLEDPARVLIRQTMNVHAARQMRFTSVADVAKLEKTLLAYVRAAARAERSGEKVAPRKPADLALPAELARALRADGALAAAFAALTPGRQRRYAYWVSQPKLAKTREARLEKCVPRIRDGLGLDD